MALQSAHVLNTSNPSVKVFSGQSYRRMGLESPNRSNVGVSAARHGSVNYRSNNLPDRRVRKQLPISSLPCLIVILMQVSVSRSQPNIND
jgi:hypothetical protein